MNGLLIDLGNTSCKYALCRGTSILSVFRDEGADVSGTAGLLLGGHKADIIVLSSVRGEDDGLRRRLAGLCSRFIVPDYRTPMPLAIRYDSPETLGADRIASAAGAAGLFPGSDLLIFDFGTALTVDRVSAEGVFAGGNISVGLHSRLKALNLLTGRLPMVEPVPFHNSAGEMGCSTEDALRNGAVSGMVFEVEGYINRYPDHKLIFTGGDALFFVKRMKNPIFADYNLVLKGLAYIAENNAQM